MVRRILGLAFAVTTAATLGACDDSTGIEGPANMSIAFATASSVSADGPVSAQLTPRTPTAAITVGGTNGTLVLDEIWVIVAEFELEGALADCDAAVDDDGDIDDDGCEEFESPASLVQIPTDGTPVQVLSAGVPLGSYTELEWEVEDVSLDEEDEDEEELGDVVAEIEAAFGAGVWPAEASMAVVGSFTPEGATEAQAFTAFFDAEIEVEMELSPPLEITEEGANRELTVVFDPSVWFTNTDGSVLDLSSLDGELIEFELEFENGIAEIERDDDEDDDDD